MSAALGAAAVLGLLAFVAWIYGRREAPVPGRAALAGLRAGVLILLVLLIWNPTLPGRRDADVRERTVLVDASLSMNASGPEGARAWDEARRLAGDAEAAGARVLLFGASVRPRGERGWETLEAGDPASRLTPALERAAALGAGEIVVLSDLRVEDPVAAAAAARRLGPPVRFRRLGPGARNAGVAQVRLPGAPEPGATTTVEVVLRGEGGREGDSVDLELRDDDGLLARRRVPLPSAGRARTHSLEIPVPGEGGGVRLEASARLEGDGFSPDDARVAHLVVDPDREAIVLLSLRPDWEPRYLLPVLEQVTGLPARGWLALSAGRFLPLGSEDERGPPATEEAVRSAADGAGLLVVHGLDAGAPGWVAPLLRDAGRLLAFPRDPAGARAVGVEASGLREGEWYPVPEIPPSPVAGELAGAALEGVPPLAGVLPHLGGGGSGSVALRVQPGGSGPAEAALLLREAEDRRAGVVMARGFWRWGARDGDAREAYRRLWSGVAGWLLASPRSGGAPRVAPARRVVLRGAPTEWRIRGMEGDTLRLRVRAGDSVVIDTTTVRGGGSGEILRTRSLPPGRYAWEAGAAALPDGTSAGVVEVSSWSDELLRPPMEPGDSGAGAEDAADPDRAGGGRPLRRHAWPYLLALALLCAEWIGRRRQGLR